MPKRTPLNVFYDPEACMGFMAYTASRLLAGALQRRMTDMALPLTPEQWGLLTRFWNRGEMSQEELIRASGVDKSTVSRSLKVMEARGLIARRTDPRDTRRKILHLTDRAETLKQASLAAVRATLDQALDGIEPEKLAVCLEVLGRVKHNLATPDPQKGGPHDQPHGANVASAGSART